MADFTGATRYEPLAISEFETGFLPAIEFGALEIGAFRSYTFASDTNAAGRPASGQLYPRGVR